MIQVEVEKELEKELEYESEAETNGVEFIAAESDEESSGGEVRYSTSVSICEFIYIAFMHLMLWPCIYIHTVELHQICV